ncbi:hypothetical protein D3C86_1178960 [compost metagenome]
MVRLPDDAARLPSARTPTPAAVLMIRIWPAFIAPNAVASMASPLLALVLDAALFAPAAAVAKPSPSGVTSWRPATTLICLPAFSAASMPIDSPIRLILPTVPSMPVAALPGLGLPIWILPPSTRKPAVAAVSKLVAVPAADSHCGVPVVSVTWLVLVNPAPLV